MATGLPKPLRPTKLELELSAGKEEGVQAIAAGLAFAQTLGMAGVGYEGNGFPEITSKAWHRT
jgi:hypothetical protein